MFLAGGEHEGRNKTWGFLTVSLSDTEPTWQGRHKGGLRRAKVSRGKSEEREQNRRGRTMSIFRLQYRIASHTGYIGNPSTKSET
jgi:hypothetical protein